MNDSQSSQTMLRYPDPVRAPAVPYNEQRRHNPRLSGWFLVIFAIVIERVAFIRKLVWNNAGFGSLTIIREHIDEIEARFDPTVIPIGVPDSSHRGADERKIKLETFSNVKLNNSKSSRYSVANYRSQYLSGDITPLAVAKVVLPMIQRDTQLPGEHSRAWIDVNADLVLEAAKRSTLRYQEKRSLGPLDGILVAIKDEYDVEGYATTLGSAKESVDGKKDVKRVDSWCVEKLKEAGAIVLGKVSMVEYGMDTSGNNITYGTPLNPYNPAYYCGGSSSGSAYAVSTGLVPIAMGSDAGGSVRIPSSFCSVYGLKPSHNRLSFRPNPNHSSTCAVKGPIAADMSSLSAVYDVVSQPHPNSPFELSTEASQTMGHNSDKPRVMGIPKRWFQHASPGIQQLCRSMIDRLCANGNYTTVNIDIPFVVEGRIAHALTMLTDAATVLPDTQGISPAIRILLALGRTTPSTDYLLAQKLRNALMQHLAWLWKKHPGMIIVTPTTACVGWPIQSASELTYGISDGDRTQETMEYIWLANFCGAPSISVPAGYAVPEGKSDMGISRKIPVGLMATGEWASEDALVCFGSDVEDLVVKTQRLPPTWVDVIKLAKQHTEEDEAGQKTAS
ncbi:amidase signature enzyme [Aaosphaeria arxii CBS 175.79]|uniref:Amidase signature enzyme n=1 Tax=Aaosphaeria arxii CBS 175.79 TaxID=1450172 RepID=A0A6A5Y5Y5_9PLEO|nr:amidase signature enzyme [Aaosphaeria arxii CBS 175.79]KAF2020918.1 amidase signature enzyme [Aaosphaeria arxii CBS 175.79]